MTTSRINELLDLAHIISPYTVCGEGNVSARVDNDTFLIKASGTSLHTLSEEDLTLCNINGAQIELLHKKPSIETSFHAWIMKTFPEVNFIAHTHPPHTTKVLCTSPSILSDFADYRWFPDQIVRNGTKSCVVPYAPPGETILKLVEKHLSEFVDRKGFFPKLILLQNHGIITASASKKDCAAATLMCEKSAEIFVGAHALGGVKFLTEQEVADVDTCPNENYRRRMYQ
jgi:ribulose-5-phosphate 4-epimerase/fuculose-1-phosphate aldolase